MNTLISMAVGALSLLATGVALAQTGHMADVGGHGMGWGYGGFWGAVLLGALIVAVVVLLMNRRQK
ncbi:MAG: hypothetical protein ACNA8G_12055 [Gammaproteobacteria bacterium]